MNLFCFTFLLTCTENHTAIELLESQNYELLAFVFLIFPRAITCIMKSNKRKAMSEVIPGFELSQNAAEGHTPKTAVSEYHHEPSLQKLW